MTKNGRGGQRQAGVDIYGPDDLGRLIGIQCKNKRAITFDEIQLEVVKAEEFQPELQGFFIATASEQDSALQKTVRLYSERRVGERKFPVGVLFWDDIIQELLRRPDEFRKHYPQLVVSQGSNPLSAESLVDSGWSVQCRNLVQRQLDLLAALPLLPTSPSREAVGFLFPEVFVDPPIETRKQSHRTARRLQDWARKHLGAGRRVVLVGDPGMGKTTSLISVFRSYASAFLDDPRNPIPLFVNARDWNDVETRSAEDLAESLARGFGLPWHRPMDGAEPYRYIIFIDALDESRSAATGAVHLRVLDSSLLSHPHILSCRLDFFYRVLDHSKYLNRYFDIAELLPWRIKEETELFITNYFAEQAREPSEKQEFRRFIASFSSPMLSTPLTVTMLLFIWRYGQRDGVTAIHSKADLYATFLRDWCEREVGRESSSMNDATILQEWFVRSAWAIFRLEREDVGPGTRSFTLSEIARVLLRESGTASTDTLRDPAFLSMFMVVPDRESGELRIRSFRHESIYEFAISRTLVTALVKDQPRLAVVFQYFYTYEINVFARETILALDPSDQTVIRARLMRTYNSERGNEAGVLLRNSCAYWLGRMAAPELGEIFDEIMDLSLPEHPMVLGTIGSGMILQNDPVREPVYLDLLAGDTIHDIRNRKYHLVYYGDQIAKTPDDFLLDEVTTDKDDWVRTRAALLRRFRSRDERDLRLRTLDLVTFRRIAEARHHRKLTEREMEAVVNSDVGIEELPEYKQILIRAEKEKLLDFVSFR